MAKYSFKINKNDSGQSVSRFLRKVLENVPATKIYSLIRKREVRINNKVIKDKNLVLKEFDLVNIFLKDAKISSRSPELKDTEIDFEIVFEDEDVLVVDKEPGITVHGEKNSLDNQVLKYLIEKQIFQPKLESTFIPSHFYRLDKLTSGLMIYAKKASILREAKARINDHRFIQKKYLAIVPGEWKIKETFFDVPMTKTNQGVVVWNLGKLTKTIIHQVKNSGEQQQGRSLLEIELRTGHKHQIRVLLSHLGYPVIGDARYGSEIFLGNKIALWACEICWQDKVFKSLRKPDDFLN